jgi:hypothetical protein
MTAWMDELRRRRDYECRLTPDRVLQSIGEAAAFLRDRGMLTRTADCALPSLFEACHEEPYQQGGHGFAGWPATKWSWAGELADRDDAHMLHIHREKNLLVSDDVLALVDPICRAELARMEQADPGWGRLLRHLADTGPAMTEDIELELGLKHKELRSLRSPLQRCGALVSRQVIEPAADGSGHVHRSELARWDHAYPVPATGPADVVALLGAGLRAAVLAPERDLIRWFSWRWLLPADVGDQLIDRGLAARPAPGWLAALPAVAVTQPEHMRS